MLPTNTEQLDPKKPEAEVALTPAQWVALPLLASGIQKKEVAAAAGVCPQTISDWLHLPAFTQALGVERAEYAARVKCRLNAMVDDALAGISDLMKSKNELIKLKACTMVVAHSLALSDQMLPSPGMDTADNVKETLLALGVNVK